MPVLSVYMDYYVRVFVRVYTAPKEVKDTPSQRLCYIYQVPPRPAPTPASLALSACNLALEALPPMQLPLLPYQPRSSLMPFEPLLTTSSLGTGPLHPLWTSHPQSCPPTPLRLPVPSQAPANPPST